jgi:hypothetical protein
MLSFELSVIDVVLIVAVIILLLFHLARTPNKSDVKSKLGVQTEKSLKKGKMRKLVSKTSRKKSSSVEEKSPVKCSYHFGYLSSIPKGEDSMPEECYSCSWMMRCLFSAEKEVVEVSS